MTLSTASRARWTAALALALICALAGPARAHQTKVPHQLVMTQVVAESDSLLVSVWTERPTRVVVREFREAFSDDRTKAADQDAQFRAEQWRRLGESIHVLVDGQAVDAHFVPVDLANNGKGGAETFFYAVRWSMPLSEAQRRGGFDVQIDNQALIEQPHVFLSAYSEAGAGWRVASDSAVELLAGGTKSSSGYAPPGATWSHDDRVRRWSIRFEPAQKGR